MTIAQRIGQVAASAETSMRAGEFAALAKFIMASGGVSKETAGNVVLVDASGIATGSGDLVLNEFREGMVQLDTSPDSPPSASTNFVSLWQLNLSALVVERFFVAGRLRSDAVAVCSNSNSYQSGNSPP